MNCYDLLNEVKEIKNFRSDNELAKFLGITRQAIHGIKNGGGFNDEIAIKVCEITKRNLSEILLIREISCEHNEKIKAAWENISKLSGIAASVAIACILTTNDAEAAGLSNVYNNDMLYIMRSLWTRIEPGKTPGVLRY